MSESFPRTSVSTDQNNTVLKSIEIDPGENEEQSNINALKMEDKTICSIVGARLLNAPMTEDHKFLAGLPPSYFCGRAAGNAHADVSQEGSRCKSSSVVNYIV